MSRPLPSSLPPRPRGDTAFQRSSVSALRRPLVARVTKTQCAIPPLRAGTVSRCHSSVRRRAASRSSAAFNASGLKGWSAGCNRPADRSVKISTGRPGRSLSAHFQKIIARDHASVFGRLAEGSSRFRIICSVRPAGEVDLRGVGSVGRPGFLPLRTSIVPEAPPGINPTVLHRHQVSDGGFTVFSTLPVRSSWTNKSQDCPSSPAGLAFADPY